MITGDRLGVVSDTDEISIISYRKTKQHLTPTFLFDGVGVPAAAHRAGQPAFAMLTMVASVTGVLTDSFADRLRSGKRLVAGRMVVVGQLLEQRRRRALPDQCDPHERRSATLTLATVRADPDRLP